MYGASNINRLYTVNTYIAHGVCAQTLQELYIRIKAALCHPTKWSSSLNIRTCSDTGGCINHKSAGSFLVCPWTSVWVKVTVEISENGQVFLHWR